MSGTDVKSHIAFDLTDGLLSHGKKRRRIKFPVCMAMEDAVTHRYIG
jgi:hypothetical protein